MPLVVLSCQYLASISETCCLFQKPQHFDDYTEAYKRCQSQFTDTADYRRNGRNTWQDESGIYHNSHHKADCPTYQRNDPFRVNPEALLNQQKREALIAATSAAEAALMPKAKEA